MKFAACVVSGSLALLPLVAQVEPSEVRPAEPASPSGVKSVVTFEPDAILGDTTQPAVSFMTARSRTLAKSLIRMRTDFRAEVLRSPTRL